VGHNLVAGVYTKYTIFVRSSADDTLHLYFRDTLDNANDRNIAAGAYEFSTNDDNLNADFDVRSAPTKAWVAGVRVISGSGLQKTVTAYHYTFDGTRTPTFNSAVDITTASIPSFITIMYVSDSSFYLAAWLSKSQNSVFVVTGSGTGSPSVRNKIMVDKARTWFGGASTGTVIVTVGIKVGAESAALSLSQAIITKSDLSLDVTAYSCYNT
jgi:hypothetical protein